MSSSDVNIGIVNYPGAMLSSAMGFQELFSLADRICREHGIDGRFQAELYDIDAVACAMLPGAEQTSLQVIVLPSGVSDGYLRAPDRVLIDWILMHHSRGAIICSACAGAFVIAASGLLENRVATTHWNLADDFAAQFPTVTLEIDKILINDGDIVTAGGLMSWIDLGLELVAQFRSPAIMRQLGKFLVVDTGHREQRYYRSFSPKLDHGDKAILKAQHHIQANFSDPLSVPVLSGLCFLSERTFLRRFVRATGLKPTQYLQSLRVQKACELIESTADTFESIAPRVGYQDVSAFRKIFQKVVGLTPREFRGRFAST